MKWKLFSVKMLSHQITQMLQSCPIETIPNSSLFTPAMVCPEAPAPPPRHSRSRSRGRTPGSRSESCMEDDTSRKFEHADHEVTSYLCPQLNENTQELFTETSKKMRVVSKQGKINTQRHEKKELSA